MGNPSTPSRRDGVRITAADLLTVPEGDITQRGLRQNINVGIQYLESWLSGVGTVALFNLMEDVATAEISRAQVWQWVHRRGRLEDGRRISAELVRAPMDEELASIESSVGESRYTGGKYELAARVFAGVALEDRWVDFLTLAAYRYLT